MSYDVLLVELNLDLNKSNICQPPTSCDIVNEHIYSRSSWLLCKVRMNKVYVTFMQLPYPTMRALEETNSNNTPPSPVTTSVKTEK